LPLVYFDVVVEAGAFFEEPEDSLRAGLVEPVEEISG